MGVKKGHQHTFELAWEHAVWRWTGEQYERRNERVYLCACGEPGYSVPAEEGA